MLTGCPILGNLCSLFGFQFPFLWDFPGGWDSKESLQCRRPEFDPWVRKILWRRELAIHSSILAWRISWTEEPGRPQSLGSQRVGHGWVTNIFTFPLKLRWASDPRWVEEIKIVEGLLQESRWDHDFPDYESSIGNRETWTDFDHWMWQMTEREGERISPSLLA